MRAPPLEKNRPPGEPGTVHDIESSLAAAQFDDQEHSSASDLLQEFARAAAKAHEADTFDWLTKRLCISENLLHGVRSDYPEGHPWRVTASLVGVARIEAQGQHWQPVEKFANREGKPALVVPVAPTYTPIFFNPIDLIAFKPGEPDRWRFRRGIGDVLGEDAIRRTVFTEAPLIIRDDPLLWLQTGATDCVVLDWTAHIPFYLADVKRLLVATPRVAERIAASFDGYGKPPEIRVMRPE